MKISECLIEKKDLVNRINELVIRYKEASLVEINEVPDESGSEILQQLLGANARLEYLTVSINKNNNIAMVGDLTLMEAIVHRDSLKSRVSQYTQIIDQLKSRNQQRRYDSNSPKLVLSPEVDISTLTQTLDLLSKELRVLDVAIQEVNWMTEMNFKI
jgi:uncharacterized protein DUF6847